MWRRTSRCAALFLAVAFALLGYGQAPAAAVSDPPETIAAADELAATAGTTAGEASTTLAQPPPSWAPSAAAIVPTSEAGGRVAKWMGVDPENIRWLRLGNWEGSLGVSYSGAQTESGSDFPKTKSQLATEYLTIRNTGFSIFDPRLVIGTLGVTLGLDQQRQTTGDSSQSTRGDIKGYAFNASFLNEKPLNARIWATRVEGFSTLPFVGTQDSIESTIGGAVDLYQTSWLREAGILPYFDANFQAYQQHTLQKTNYGKTSSSFDQTQDLVSLTAHNGTESSDLTGSIQYIDFQYPSFPEGAYHSIGGNVYFSGDYGADLGTTWTSAIAYNSRTGDIPLESSSVNQAVTVHHTADVQSIYLYNLYQQRSGEFSNLNQSASANVSASIWRHLAVTAGATGVYNRYSQGTVEGASGSLGLDYTRPLPGDGQVAVTLQGGYNWAKDALSSGEVAIVEETHSAPPVLGIGTGFALNSAFVVASSIVVVNTRGGARLPTTVNVDYTVVTDGEKTRVVVLPTSRVIQSNDPLAVSYTYLLPSQANYHSSSESVTVGVDYQWFGVSYSRTQTQSPPLTQGGVQFVGDSTSDSLLGSLRWTTDVLNAGLAANVIRFDSATLAYNTRTYSAGVNWAPSWVLALDFTGGWSTSDYTLPIARTSGATTARADLNFYPPEGWLNGITTLTLYAMRNRTTDSLLPTQTLTAAGANLKHVFGRLTLAASGQYGQFERGGSSIKSTQFNVSLARAF